jgi:hypothetical protein
MAAPPLQGNSRRRGAPRVGSCLGPSDRTALRRSGRRKRERAAPVALAWRSRSCRFPCRSSVGCGLLAFTASLLPFHRFRSRLQGVPDRRMLKRFRSNIRPPPSLHVRRARLGAGPPGDRRPREREPRTPHGPAFLGLDPSGSPSPAPAAVHSRKARKPSIGPWLPHHGIAFRPRGFSPPRRVSPRRRARACCIPVPDMGFAAFHVRQAAGARGTRGGRLGGSRPEGRDPTGSSQRRPFEGLLLAGSCAASPQPMPSCRCAPPRHNRGRVRGPTRSTCRHARRAGRLQGVGPPTSP